MACLSAWVAWLTDWLCLSVCMTICVCVLVCVYVSLSPYPTPFLPFPRPSLLSSFLPLSTHPSYPPTPLHHPIIHPTAHTSLTNNTQVPASSAPPASSPSASLQETPRYTVLINHRKYPYLIFMLYHGVLQPCCAWHKGDILCMTNLGTKWHGYPFCIIKIVAMNLATTLVILAVMINNYNHLPLVFTTIAKII